MNRIKSKRLETKSKAADLAAALGITVQSYYAYERDESRPSANTLAKLSAFYQCPMEELMEIPFLDESNFDKFFSRLPKTNQVPRLGVIACGRPILCEENFSGFDDVPEQIQCDFTLMCQGDSMVGARINDGDIVYIRKQPDVENREIAAVLIDEETVTLKRVFKNDLGKPVLLLPENPRFDPIDCTRHTIRILGKAVGFMSRL